MGHPVNQRTCLAAAGTGNNQQRTFQMSDCLMLGPVKILPVDCRFPFTFLVVLR